ncbi:hypothetical protein ACRALDRAFT_212404 [Sodiomyces alcalophilus JCM 7366]|uniref:uncharacterized protein n=1 Tax=Sodiomyces alcalophilus JCM 7366 TaxID=591952 RepID=UPI0039B3A935
MNKFDGLAIHLKVVMELLLAGSFGLGATLITAALWLNNRNYSTPTPRNLFEHYSKIQVRTRVLLDDDFPTNRDSPLEVQLSDKTISLDTRFPLWSPNSTDLDQHTTRYPPTHHAGHTMTRKLAMHQVPLEPYLQCFYDPDQTSQSPIFNTAQNETPTLRRRYPNTILVMPGSYNPPHYGHLELVKHGLARGGADLNILAAIIIPTDDLRLSSKFAGRHRPLARGLPPNVFVFEKPDGEWRAFCEQVARAIRADGFSVEFMALVGPDYVSLSGIHDPTKWGCRNTMVTDVCRPVDFVAGGGNGGTPMRISACDEWKRVSFRPSDVGRFLEAKMRERHASRNDLKAVPLSPSLRTWNGSRSAIRFVPWREATRKPDVSSTHIRNIIVSCENDDDIEDALDGLALSPHILAEYVKTLPDRKGLGFLAGVRKKRDPSEGVHRASCVKIWDIHHSYPPFHQ